MNWSSALFEPTLAPGIATDINVHGSLLLSPLMTFNYLGNFDFKAASATHSINSATQTLGTLSFIGPGLNQPSGIWELVNNLDATTINLDQGTLDLNNYDVAVTDFILRTSQTRLMDLDDVNLTIDNGKWDVQDGTNLGITSGTSDIFLTGLNADFSGGSVVLE